MGDSELEPFLLFPFLARKCSKLEFGCHDDDCSCIASDWECDGTVDCPNNRDEMDCDVTPGKYCDLYLLYGVVVKLTKNFFPSLNL